MNPWQNLVSAAVPDSNMSTLYSVAQFLIPSAIAVTGVIVTAWLMRRSQREQNKTEAQKGDTNAFQVVTDQLFKLNEGLGERVEELGKRVESLEAELAVKDAKITAVEAERDESRAAVRQQLAITQQLANYIKQLISAWPLNAGPPPTPDPPIDWKRHL